MLTSKQLIHCFKWIPRTQVIRNASSTTQSILANSIEDKVVKISKMRKLIEDTGVRWSDPRLGDFVETIKKIQTMEKGSMVIKDIAIMERLLDENIGIMHRLLGQDLVIPEFKKFCDEIRQMYDKCAPNMNGQVACYIPQLARYSPDYWAVSICTVDGQRYSLGNVDIPFTMQSCSKPFTYGMCINELSEDVVHRFIGHEPSGRNFNEICLDSNCKPHNPMLNSGAIMSSALLSTMVEPKMKSSEKFDYMLQYMKKIAGGEFMGFNNAVFLSERETADRNYAMAYYMKEKRCFPPLTKLNATMDLYFQSCSMEITTETLSVMGASLANGGICPPTGEKVLDSESVRNVLSLMFTCGMYNYSGEFSFTCGLPAKSGVSGALLLVIPNVMGIGLWSPPLDEKGNSVRGIEFCEHLVDKFNFHRFDNLLHSEKKSDPRRNIYSQKGRDVVSLLFAAQNGDLGALRRMFLQGMDMNQCDYDGRTALHLCASEGHVECAKFLLNVANVNREPHDRWNFTPLDEAERLGGAEMTSLLTSEI